MDSPQTRRIRTLGILAHIDAGKTSLTERLLYVSGRIRQAGAVDQGTTATDYLEIERERGITVKAAAVGLSWKGVDVRIVDTPGHVDFGGEVARSVRVLDSAIVLLCGVAGIQSRTEAIFKACESRSLPRIYFINKLDRRGASFDRVYSELRGSLDSRAIALQLPIGMGEGFSGLVDLVSMRAYTSAQNDGSRRASGFISLGNSDLVNEPIPEELKPVAIAARSALVEVLAEGDEGMLSAYAEGREPSPTELRLAIRGAALERRIMPVLCGSAFEDLSPALLLDAAVAYLPEPLEAGCPEGFSLSSGSLSGSSAARKAAFSDAFHDSRRERRRASSDDFFSAFIFKTSVDEHFGRLSWGRVWSGKILPRDRVLEASTGKLALIRAMLSPEASSMAEVASAEAGDIVAFALQSVSGKDRDKAEGSARPASNASASRVTASSCGEESLGASGATLCDPRKAIVYEAIAFSEPVVSMALEPRTKEDSGKLKAGVAALVESDPSLRAREDRETGRLLLEGLGELHLEVAVDRLEREYGARVRAGRPSVAFKEGLIGSARARMDFDRDENGERLKALVGLFLSPGKRGGGLELDFSSGLKPSLEAQSAVRRGLEAALSVGPASGYPVEDASVLVEEFVTGSGRGGSRKEAKAEELAVEIATSLAARECLIAAGALLLEPWMRVELLVTEERLGEAMQALTGREGRIEAVEDRGDGKLVIGSAPLRALFGFATELGSATAGRASYSARFSRYQAANRAGTGIGA